MLSQTSWISLPLFPNLVRSLSKHKTERNSGPDSQSDPETPETDCGICSIFWKTKATVYEVEEAEDITTPQEGNKYHSDLKDINEDEEEEDEDGVTSDRKYASENGDARGNSDVSCPDQSSEDAGKGNNNDSNV